MSARGTHPASGGGRTKWSLPENTARARLLADLDLSLVSSLFLSSLQLQGSSDKNLYLLHLFCKPAFAFRNEQKLNRYSLFREERHENKRLCHRS